MRTTLTQLALLALLLTTAPWRTAPAQWTNDPWNGMVAATNLLGENISPKVIRLGSGNYLIVWINLSQIRVRYQLLNPQGVVLLDPAGLFLIDEPWENGYERFLLPDGEGGALLVFDDLRNGYKDIYGQHFDSLGNRLWGETGLPLVVWPGAQNISAKDVVTDSLGNFFISCVANSNIYIQKFRADGTLLWGPYGAPVCVGQPYTQEFQESVPDMSGGIIDVWRDSRLGAEQRDLYAQHLDPNGNPLWDLNGIPLTNPHTGAQLWGYLGEGVSDGHGGGVWVYDIFYNWYLFRMTGQGQIIWYYSNLTPDTCYVGELLRHPIDNTFWVSNIEKRAGLGWGWYLYRFNLNGNPLWGVNGIAQGGFLAPTLNGVIALQSVSQLNAHYLKATRLDSLGGVEWTAHVNYCHGSVAGSGVYGYPVSISDYADGIICVWEDQRDWDFDIYAQRVQANGGLGDPLPSPPHAPIYPRFNLFWTGRSVRFTLPQVGEIRLELFDLLGRRVAEVAAGYFPLGYHEVKLNQNELSSGIYLLRLTASAQSQALKIALIK